MSTTREKDKLHFRSYGQAHANQDACFADGCAHRDAQVVAFLREQSDAALARKDYTTATVLNGTILAIERGEHVK